MQHRAASGHVDHGFHIDWESVCSWVERARKEERLAEIGLAAAFLTILGWSVFAFQKALQNYQVVESSFF